MKSHLDLTVELEPLGKAHQRFFDEQLGPGVTTKDFERFERRRYPKRVVAQALASWQARTHDEYRSQVAFTGFLNEVTQLGASFDVLSAGVRLVRDEARHVELCRRLVLALGGDARIPGEPQWAGSDPKQPLFVRVARTIGSSLCMGETVSAKLLGATLRHTVDPLARSVVEVLTRDESFHAELGWALWPQVWSVATSRDKSRLKKDLAADFEFIKHAALEGTVESDEPRNPFGDLLPHERAEVTRRCFSQRIVPGFARYGITLDWQ